MPEGKRITTLEQLAAASAAKKAIVTRTQFFTNRHMPAAFILNMSGSVLHCMMRQGMFIYTPKQSQP